MEFECCNVVEDAPTSRRRRLGTGPGSIDRPNTALVAQAAWAHALAVKPSVDRIRVGSMSATNILKRNWPLGEHLWLHLLISAYNVFDNLLRAKNVKPQAKSEKRSKGAVTTQAARENIDTRPQFFSLL